MLPISLVHNYVIYGHVDNLQELEKFMWYFKLTQLMRNGWDYTIGKYKL